MKDKVIKSNVTAAIEKLCHELRAYTGDSLTCTVTIITRAKGASWNGLKPEGTPDWYKANIIYTEATDHDDSILDESARIFYGPDDFGEESIVLVMPYKDDKFYQEEGAEDG